MPLLKMERRSRRREKPNSSDNSQRLEALRGVIGTSHPSRKETKAWKVDGETCEWTK
jgi:hypothetical protein